MLIKNKKGFISTIVIYSLFLLFLGVLVVLINAYTNNRLIVSSQKEDLTTNLDDNYNHPIHYHVGDPLLGTGCYTVPVKCSEEKGNTTCYTTKQCTGTIVTRVNYCGGKLRVYDEMHYHNNYWHYDTWCNKHNGYGQNVKSQGTYYCQHPIGSYTICPVCGTRNLPSGSRCTHNTYILKEGYTDSTVFYYKTGCGYEEGEEEK